MINRVIIECQFKDEAKRFAREINEALDLDGDDTLADVVDGTNIVVTWGDTADPTELFDALNSARDEMEWEFE